MSDKKWIYANYPVKPLGSLSLVELGKILQKAIAAEKRGEWRDLRIDTERDRYSDYEQIVIVGQRLETDAEFLKRETEEKQARERGEEFERKQYELLKKKFEQ